MRFFSESISKSARIYVLGVVFLALPVFIYSLQHVILSADHRWLVLALLAAVGSYFPVVIPLVRNKRSSLSVTVGDVFIFTALLLLGPEAAAVISTIEGLASTLRAKVRHPYKYLFNSAQLVISSYGVGLLFYWMHQSSAPLDPSAVNNFTLLFFQVSFCGIVYFFLNTGIVAFGVSLATEQPILQLWKQNFVWASLTHMAGASLGAFIFIYFNHIEFYSFLVASPVVILLYYAYKMNLTRIRQTQQHLDEVNRLLDEKIQAEKELQKAKENLEVRVLERTTELRTANRNLLREVTDRKEAERALAAEKERLAVTLRSIGDAVIASDTEGQILLMNKVAEQLTGWNYSEAAGRPLQEVYRILDVKTRRHFQTLGKLLEEGPAESDIRNAIIVSREGVERQISHTAAPIVGWEGQRLGMVLVIRDITEQIQMEEELLKAQKLESVGVLAGGIAHDFNNILSGILLKTQLAQRVIAKGNDPAHLLESIEEATQMATGLTQQLLTFARGGAPIKKTASIKELLEESARFSLRGSKVHGIFEIDPDLWSADIDEGQISQVINNLVINAEQAMPSGGLVTLTAKNVEITENSDAMELEAGRYVQISIEDEGVGISEEALPKIFDPYFTTKKKGHGLGLASAYSIIQRHGGYIRASSREGEGSTFTFYLPASESIVPSKVQSESTVTEGFGRVLVMDDEEIIRNVLSELLKELGYEAEFAVDGSQAIAIYRDALRQSRPFDVVIMDLTVPGGMGGKETIQRLLEIDPAITAIVSSGYSSDPVMANYQDYGFQAVLAKPLDMKKISRVLNEVLKPQSPQIAQIN